MDAEKQKTVSEAEHLRRADAFQVSTSILLNDLRKVRFISSPFCYLLTDGRDKGTEAGEEPVEAHSQDKALLRAEGRL